MPQAQLRWTVVSTLVKEIEVVFASPSQMMTALGITAPTWNKIKSGAGTKQSTADTVVKKFFSVLLDIESGSRDGHDVLVPYVERILAKYRKDVDNLDFDKFTVQAKAKAPATAGRESVNLMEG